MVGVKIYNKLPVVSRFNYVLQVRECVFALGLCGPKHRNYCPAHVLTEFIPFPEASSTSAVCSVLYTWCLCNFISVLDCL